MLYTCAFSRSRVISIFTRNNPVLLDFYKLLYSRLSSCTKQITLEEKWIPIIRKHDEISCKKWRSGSCESGRLYTLSMFPYPSGMLHLGHLRVYTVADVLCRYGRLKGFRVFYPMGWDAFGLPAENAAIERLKKPDVWTESNIEQMRAQMDKTMLLSIDWSSEISTCDASYYKWTQWLFLKLFAAGLAYRRSAFVNWDPVDMTVLADELIDREGRSWRSGAVVERRPLRQWYFRITKYSKSLLDGLHEIEKNQWRDVVPMQRGWIGKLDGTQVEFDLCLDSDAANSQEQSDLTNERMAVFTKQPGLAVADLVSYIAVTPESVFYQDAFRQPVASRGVNSSRSLVLHTPDPDVPGDPRKLMVSATASASPWAERLAISAWHPFSKRKIPMVRVPGVHLKSTVAFPDQLVLLVKDSHHGEVAQLLDLEMPKTKVCRMTSQDPVALDPAEMSMDELKTCTLITPVTELNSVPVANSDVKAMCLLVDAGRGGYLSNESRSDWLVSRQRYWGTPIPIVHCKACGVVPVPEDQLPITLPPLDGALTRGAAPLKETSWCKTTCPKCGGAAQRETDTLDTFVDSSWYYLRFLDSQNTSQLCDPRRSASSLPVNVYVGGIEHAIRHLYYARFMAHFLHDIGLLPCREPFLRFLPIGLVLGRTFVEPTSGRYVPSAAAVNKPPGSQTWVEESTGLPLKVTWDKMSKSKLNGVDPDTVVQQHGREAIRLTMLANVGPHQARKWQDNGVIQGVKNWQTRLFRLTGSLLDLSAGDAKNSWNISTGAEDPLGDESGAFSVMHQSIVAQVDNHYSNTFVLSDVVARLHELTDLLRKTAIFSGGPGPQSFVYLRALADLVVMLSPLAPVLACELWSQLQCALAQAPQPVRLLLNPKASASVGQAAVWPYDLEKLVLEQPFPVVRRRVSEESSDTSL